MCRCSAALTDFFALKPKARRLALGVALIAASQLVESRPQLVDSHSDHFADPAESASKMIFIGFINAIRMMARAATNAVAT